MKAKKIISIALTITMLLMTPMQAVFCRGTARGDRGCKYRDEI